MRTLIVGDLHNKWNLAEAAISQIPHDRVVFVGDYFDEIGDGRKKAGKTASWLKKSLSAPNRTHLFGNHDFTYFKPKFSCPGWNERKHKKVNYILTQDDWKKIRFHTWVDQFLVTHAGVHPCHLPQTNNIDKVKEWLEEQEQEWLELIERNERFGIGTKNKHWFLNRSISRGGIDTFPGVLWQDWHEDFASGSWDFFAPKFILHQIVGHTPTGGLKKKYWKGSTNYCVDCLWKTCMVIDNGVEEFWNNNWDQYNLNPEKTILKFTRQQS